MRSSAIDEDTVFTFAGQYCSYLNVRKDELLDCYKKVLASRFTPAALSHFMARGLAEADLAMGVGCMAVIDAAASGVIYTRDPLNADSDYMLVNAVFGLGSYLVEGVLTPDVFHVFRQDGTSSFRGWRRNACNSWCFPAEGSGQCAVPGSSQEQASIGAEPLRLLAEYALKVEAHYGAPQDIEWAIDRQGKLFLLQTRPLRVIKRKAVSPAPAELQAQRLAEKERPFVPAPGRDRSSMSARWPIWTACRRGWCWLRRTRPPS